MTGKKLLMVAGTLVLITVVGVFVASTVFAQETTPPAQTTPANPCPGGKGWGGGFGMWGGSTATFDATAEALGLTPTQLFEELHGGKTLADIAKEKGVDLQKVQDAAKASQTQAMKDAITQAVKDGKMTQAQADWLLKGLDQGFLPRGRGFGFGHEMGRGMRGGMRGMRGFWGEQPSQAHTAPAPGTSS
jgi:hypothetical protein